MSVCIFAELRFQILKESVQIHNSTEKCTNISYNLTIFASMITMIFTLMPMFVCLFWSMVLATELLVDGKNKPKAYLLAFMLTAAVLYFCHGVYFNHDTNIMPVSNTLYSVVNLSVYPLFYFYIRSLSARSNHHSTQWTLLIPAILLGVATGTLNFQMTEEERLLFFEKYLYDGTHEGLTGLPMQQAVVHDLCKGAFILLLIPVFVMSSRHMKQYEKTLSNTYADLEGRTLKSIRHLLIVFIAAAVFSMVFILIGRHHFADTIWLLAIPSIFFSLILFAVGMIGHRQTFCIEDIEMDDSQIDEDFDDQPSVPELRQRIEQLMEKEQLYLHPNLKIVDLVQRLGTNRNYLYMAINREMGVSFTEYVNRMRIEYAVMLINQHPTKSLTEVAEQAGFSSASSFYRNFRQFKGMGPREYQNNLNQ